VIRRGKGSINNFTLTGNWSQCAAAALTSKNVNIAFLDVRDYAYPIQNISGAGDMSIIGTNGPDTINGTSGNDTIFGLGGNDVLNGFAGNDVLIGGTGADTMNGGSDGDLYEVESSGDVVNEAAGGGGNDVVAAQVNWVATAGSESRSCRPRVLASYS
jgi:Ca2+-binding RTX toxin-like protein